MRENNALGQNIARLRKARGITQAELAEQLHFTYQAVSNWERGVSEPDSDTLLRLAAFFGVSTDELLGKSDNSALSESVPPRPGAAGESRLPRRVSPALARSHAEGAVSGAAQANSAGIPPEILQESWRLMSRVRGLRVSLIVFTVCSLVEFLFALFGNAAAVLFIVLPAGIVAAVAYIAVTVFLFVVKAPSTSVAARMLFIAGIAVSEGAGIALLFLSPAYFAAYLSVALVGLAFGILRVYFAPFAFRRKESGMVKAYLILVTVQFVGTVLSTFLPGEGWAILFNCISQPINIIAPWLLNAVTENREAGVDYAAENAEIRRENEVLRHRRWETFRTALENRLPRSALLFWVTPCAFVVCAAAILGVCFIRFSFEEDIPFNVLPNGVFSCLVFPMIFVLCLWFVKAGAKNRAVHWVLFALWFTSFALGAAYWFLDLCELYTVETWEKVLYTAVPFAAFVATVFLFPDRWKAWWARLIVRAGAVLAAAACSGVCLWLALSQESISDTAVLTCSYMLLIFLLSLCKAECPPKEKEAKRDNTAAAKG